MINTKTEKCIRPTTISSVKDLKDFYWLKIELVEVCRSHGLSTYGSKHDLIERIGTYFRTGNKENAPRKKQLLINRKDSEAPITKHTLVQSYMNDVKTRGFFVKHIGGNFKFNAYLRQFTNPDNITPGLTYGDLISGWLLSKSKKSPADLIPKQFEYNQFIKDYFLHETDGCLDDAINAWRFIKSISGSNTYKRFKDLSNEY